MADDPRLLQLMKRIGVAESRLLVLEESLTEDPVERVERDVRQNNVYTSIFVKVAADYYDQTLAMRANTLKCSVQQLCKSIIFENTAWVKESEGELEDATNSRYYLVVVQYQAKFDAELLRDLIHGLRKPENRLPRKRFHFQLAEEKASNILSGFSHNGISPFGMLSPIPVVICSRCIAVKPPYLYMGGGKIDVKLGISVSDFLRSTAAIVGEVSTLRTTNEEI